ncbi:multicopper oxidase family protein [Marinomonas communis]|uniref:multicopper oxidase family protein n=1 Tax=Marinomonas communis TaxID=28254 RepID=UPI001D187484|nr:multicopper oxidase family protein [Marinomonas communis]MCC4273657.1 multicopper oxidase family protein [Marinomonas communis]
MDRRQFLKSSSALLTLGAMPNILLATPSEGFDYELIVAPADVRIAPDGNTPAWCFNGHFPAPVIRAKQHQPVRIRVVNKLAEPTTIHWHGLRIPIAMDGVPFLSQAPIMPGESFDYEFTPPDAGTFWYHPHMNSVEQLGKGLVGAFIVDEAEDPGFDADVVMGLKNWHIRDDGSFTALTTPRNAFRMGTPGRLMTVNGKVAPTYYIPTGGAIRARLVNIDNTQTYNIRGDGGDLTIITVDGNPIATPRPLQQHLMGPGMRLDLGFIAPDEADQIVTLYHKHEVLVRFKTVGESKQRQAMPRLPLNPIPTPDLDNAETIQFAFEWDASINPVKKDGKVNYRFWTINRKAWHGMSAKHIPEPLARLERGKTYIFELANLTQYHHPIHLHGHTFTVLDSNKQRIEPFHTDTVLLGQNETARIAFVADNPGRWMYHCHVIEHLKTGLMGYIEVS